MSSAGAKLLTTTGLLLTLFPIGPSIIPFGNFSGKFYVLGSFLMKSCYFLSERFVLRSFLSATKVWPGGYLGELGISFSSRINCFFLRDVSSVLCHMQYRLHKSPEAHTNFPLVHVCLPIPFGLENVRTVKGHACNDQTFYFEFKEGVSHIHARNR